MEESFRNSLIVISALIIGAIFVHGLWTIRKNKNPYKLKTNPKEIKVQEFEGKELRQRDFDRSGFDQDGVSQIKVINSQDSDENKSDVVNLDDTDHLSDEISNEVTNTITEPSTEFKANKDEIVDELDFNLDINVVEQDNLSLVTNVSEVVPEVIPEIKSVYENPVNKPKPIVITNKSTKSSSKVTRKNTKSTLKRDQMEINFGSNEGGARQNRASQKSVRANIDPEVLAISVIVPQGQIISGAALLPSLLTLGMKYGDMNVFHRHQDNAGNGKVTFSLVNALNPGTFDLDNIENFVTQGVSLFMTLPNAGDPFEVFEQMLVAAKQLASEFNGQLLDDKRSVMTKQTEQHYVTKIREFERKSRLASM